MSAVIAEHELFDSCRVLFGAELNVTRGFLEYLQRPGIKSAYRKKALATHPDILASQGDEAKANSADLFRMVQQAYENLSTYLDARENGFRFPRPVAVRPQPKAAPPKPQARPAPRPQTSAWSGADPANRQANKAQASNFAGQNGRPRSAWQTSQAWSAPVLPARKLLFGHYLYYAGVTNWQTIVKALVWQRTGRPRLGEIGRRFGWLTEQDILFVLKNRKLSQSFGASAVALGLLTANQLRLLLFQQNKLQKKFGDYFVQHNILSPIQINELASQFNRHNTLCSRQRYPYSARM